VGFVEEWESYLLHVTQTLKLFHFVYSARKFAFLFNQRSNDANLSRAILRDHRSSLGSSVKGSSTISLTSATWQTDLDCTGVVNAVATDAVVEVSSMRQKRSKFRLIESFNVRKLCASAVWPSSPVRPDSTYPNIIFCSIGRWGPNLICPIGKAFK